MKRAHKAVLAGVLLFGASQSVSAASLLGIVGDKDSGALVTLGSGAASSSGAVNVGLGGGGGNVLDLNVGGGGSSSLANANVSSGRSGGGLLDVDAGLLNNNVRVDASVGGGSLANVGIGIGGNGGGNGPGPGPNPGPGNGQVINNANSGSGNGSNVQCAGVSASQIDKLIRSTRVDASWQRASNVAIERVVLCPDVKSWLSAQLKGSAFGSQLRSAVANDMLASASLSRTSYGADRVFAVVRSGAQLTLFVY